jgi:tryptophan synthase alpha chain
MKKLVAYLTSGYPDKNFTLDLIEALSWSVDKLELGVPFSDPVADGEIIERANLLALQTGIKYSDVLEIAKKSAINDIYLMGYFNSFYSRGFEKSVTELKNYGIKGLIIPDLPFEESQKYENLFNTNMRELIQFVAPTDNYNRIKKILAKSSGSFIYLVAYAGITGSGRGEDLSQIINSVREVSQNELYVGFGVNEKTAREKAKNVDGVIVGSTFVKILLDNSISHSEKIRRIVESARIIKREINE